MWLVAPKTNPEGRLPVYSHGSLAERLFGLNREADDYLGRTVENLKKMVAGQATELAFSPSTGIQFNAAIASATSRTDDIGLSHV